MNLRRCATRALGLSALTSLVAFGFAALLAACGGKIVDMGNGSSSSGSQSSTNSSSNSSGGECVTVTLSPSDTTCASDDDCASVTTGHICPTSCQCGGTAANNAAATRIQNETAGISTEECPCAVDGEPECIGGQCQIVGLGGTFPDDGGVIFPEDGGGDDIGADDGGFDAISTPPPPLDGGQCVDIDLATYDQSCNQASDCITILTGEVCDGDCDCLGSPVNISGQSRYDQAIQSITFGECSCPEQASPTCVNHACTILPP